MCVLFCFTSYGPKNCAQLLWELRFSFSVSKLLTVCLCMCSYHDDQQDILEVIPEAQSGAAEQSEVSFQELQKGAQ